MEQKEDRTPPVSIRQVGLMQGDKDGINFLRFSPDAALVAAACIPDWDEPDPGRTLQVWDTETTALIRTIAIPTRVRAIDLSPDWNVLALASADGYVRLQTIDGALIVEVTEPHVEFTSVAFAPTGDRLAIGDAGGQIRLYDVLTGRMFASFRTLNADANSASPPITRVGQCVFSPDGRNLAVVAKSQYATVHIWDVATPLVQSELIGSVIKPDHSVFDLAYAPDGRVLAISDGIDNLKLDVVRLFEDESLGVVGALHVPDDIPCALAFSSDGRLMATAGAAGTVWIWDTTTWTTVASFAAHTEAWDHRAGAPEWQMTALRWAPAQALLATAGMDPLQQEGLVRPYTGPVKYTVKLWKIETHT